MLTPNTFYNIGIGVPLLGDKRYPSSNTPSIIGKRSVLALQAGGAHAEIILLEDESLPLERAIARAAHELRKQDLRVHGIVNYATQDHLVYGHTARTPTGEHHHVAQDRHAVELSQHILDTFNNYLLQ